MNRKLEFTVPEEYEGKKAFYFLRGCAGISARDAPAAASTHER